MKWFPPHIERCRSSDATCTQAFVLLAGLISGCTSIPTMHSGSVVLGSHVPLAAATLPIPPTVPEFDSVMPTLAVRSNKELMPPAATQQESVTKTPSTKLGSVVAPIPVENPNPIILTPVNGKESTVASKAQGGVSKDAAPKATNPAAKVTENTSNEAAASELATSRPVKPTVLVGEQPQVAASKSTGVLVAPPQPFAWEPNGASSGGRAFLTFSPGDDGYRSLVVGSVGGNDPVAVELVEQLARRLHDDSLILGGFDCTIIRTLNPDGEANKKFLNQKSQYINEFFPQTGGKSVVDQPAEVAFLLKQLRDHQPQRVVHVRTIKGAVGVIAASESCQTAAKEAADWLGFKLVKLPENAKSPGSMERFISTSGSSDMITFAIPESTDRGELWGRYGDTLLNLLLGDDAATRELARQQTQKSSADRRNQSPDK